MGFGLRVMVMAIGLAALASAAFLVLSRIRRAAPKKPSRKASAPEVREAGAKTSQDLVGLAGFEGRCAVSEDGTRTVFIEVAGRNGSFMSPQERDSEAMRLVSAVGGGTDAYTVHRVQLPVDASLPRRRLEEAAAALSKEIRDLECTLSEGAPYAQKKHLAALRARRELLEDVYLPQCEEAQEGFSVQTYLTISKTGVRAAEAAAQASCAMMRRLMEAGYQCREMAPDEIVRVLVNYFGRFPSASERAARL